MPYFPEDDEDSITNLARYLIEKVGPRCREYKKVAVVQPKAEELDALSLPAYFRINHSQGGKKVSDVYWLTRHPKTAAFAATRYKNGGEPIRIHYRDINAIAPARLHDNLRHD